MTGGGAEEAGAAWVVPIVTRLAIRASNRPDTLPFPGVGNRSPPSRDGRLFRALGVFTASPLERKEPEKWFARPLDPLLCCRSDAFKSAKLLPVRETDCLGRSPEAGESSPREKFIEGAVPGEGW